VSNDGSVQSATIPSKTAHQQQSKKSYKGNQGKVSKKMMLKMPLVQLQVMTRIKSKG
jgi:hypothetical protein